MRAECVRVVVGDAAHVRVHAALPLPVGDATTTPTGRAATTAPERGDAARGPVSGDMARLAGEELFDRVLVDPPCSGLGTLQARADLRWRVGPEDVEQLARSQAAILAAGAQALRPGGVLVYSTCTISPTENERQISAFLDSNPDFTLDDLGAEFPGSRSTVLPPLQGRCVLTLPHRDRTAGFFIARLRRG
jgi:16S rRNA (cytosine967-C5)-methyltransferase